MKYSFNKIRCNIEPLEPGVFASFIESKYLGDMCSTSLYEWRRFYAMLSAAIFLLYSIWHLLKLSLSCPRTPERKMSKLFPITFIPLRFNAHDILLVFKAIAIDSCAHLLFDVICENNEAIFFRVRQDSVLFLLKIFFLIPTVISNYKRKLSFEVTRELVITMIAMFNWFQLCCIAHNLYERCIFIQK